MTAPGGFVAGDVLGAADMNGLPAGVVAYAERTSNQTSISTVTDLTSLTVTFTAVAGRRYRVTSHTSWYASVASTSAIVTLYNSTAAAQLQWSGCVTGDAAGGSNNNQTSTNLLSWSGTLAAGSTTLKLQARIGDDDSGTLTLRAGATYPAFILVEDIGPS